MCRAKHQGGRRCPSCATQRVHRRAQAVVRRTNAELTGKAYADAVTAQVKKILAGQSPAAAERAAPAAEGESPIVGTIDDIQQTIGRGPGARLKLLRVENPGVEDGKLVERVGVGHVIVEQLTDGEGGLAAVILDDGTRIGLEKPTFRQGLLVLPVDGDPETRAVYKLLPPEGRLAAVDRSGVDPKTAARLDDHRELVASVSRLAVDETSRKAGSPDELRELVDRQLSAVHHELALYRKAATEAHGGMAPDDPVIDELAKRAHDAWREKVQKVRWKMAERQTEFVKKSGAENPKLTTWLGELQAIQDSVEKHLARI